MDEHTIYRLVRKGVLPGVKIGGKWGFKKDLIDEWTIKKSLQHSKDNRQ